MKRFWYIEFVYECMWGIVHRSPLYETTLIVSFVRKQGYPLCKNTKLYPFVRKLLSIVKTKLSFVRNKFYPL